MYLKGFEETGSGSSHCFIFYINLSCGFGKIKPYFVSWYFNLLPGLEK